MQLTSIAGSYDKDKNLATEMLVSASRAVNTNVLGAKKIQLILRKLSAKTVCPSQTDSSLSVLKMRDVEEIMKE